MGEQLVTANRRVRFSLRLKLSLGLILIIALIFAGVNAYSVIASRNTRYSEAAANLDTIARVITSGLLIELANHPIDSEPVRRVAINFLNSALTLNKKNKDLAYVMVTNGDGQLVVGRAKPELTILPGGKSIKDEQQLLAEVLRLDGKLAPIMRVLAFPLRLTRDGPVIGKVMVGTSMARVESEFRRDLTLNIGVFLGVLLIMVLYTGFALRRIVLAPLERVSSAMRAVQAGDFTNEVSLDRSDELGVLADNYNFMVRGLREQERLKDAFNRYVSKQVYEKFRAGQIQLSGEQRNATILFSDIRSFTTLSEQLTATEVVAMLNEYFNEMVEIVFRYDGFLNKFIGDAIMAVYNVPLDQDQPELRAVRTALEMLRALANLNAKREQRGLFPIKIGVGINTGAVVAGNIGHEKRLEYTVIGDAVNLAQRIESQTKVAGAAILISETTYIAVKDQIVAEALPPVKVKGKAEPVTLYAVRGLVGGGLISVKTVGAEQAPAG